MPDYPRQAESFGIKDGCNIFERQLSIGAFGVANSELWTSGNHTLSLYYLYIKPTCLGYGLKGNSIHDKVNSTSHCFAARPKTVAGKLKIMISKLWPWIDCSNVLNINYQLYASFVSN